LKSKIEEKDDENMVDEEFFFPKINFPHDHLRKPMQNRQCQIPHAQKLCQPILAQGEETYVYKFEAK
jgi:hypothetical protein